MCLLYYIVNRSVQAKLSAHAAISVTVQLLFEKIYRRFIEASRKNPILIEYKAT